MSVRLAALCTTNQRAHEVSSSQAVRHSLESFLSINFFNSGGCTLGMAAPAAAPLAAAAAAGGPSVRACGALYACEITHSFLIAVVHRYRRSPSEASSFSEEGGRACFPADRRLPGMAHTARYLSSLRQLTGNSGAIAFPVLRQLLHGDHEAGRAGGCLGGCSLGSVAAVDDVQPKPQSLINVLNIPLLGRDPWQSTVG